MRLSIHILLFFVFYLASLKSAAQVTRLSNNTDLETAIPLGNIAVLISKSDSLWKTDGTIAGTFKYATNVSVGPPHAYTIFLNKIYFNGTDGNGSELWVTDGTAGGTQLVENINPGAAASSPDHFIVYNNELYFFAENGVNGRELWKTNGTSGGATMVKDINPTGSSVTGFTTFFTLNNELFFVATDGTTGAELWKTNGSSAGTVPVKDINLGPASSNPAGFTQYGSMFLFAADNGSTGSELWKTDGTTAGTELVKDIATGFFGSSPTAFTVFNNKVYFDALDFTNGLEGWVTDGTTANTSLLKDINPGFESGFPLFINALFFNNTMIFSATNDTEGTELWQSDGTGPNTNLFKDINPLTQSSDPILFLNFFGATDINSIHSKMFNGMLFLEAKTPGAGTELWKTNGTPAGTVIVKDINPGTDSSMTIDSSTYFYTASHFYFSATDGATGYELWKTDGTDPNTVRVFDINPGPASARPEFIGSFNGIVLFTATDGDNTNNLRDLYRLDGVFSPPLPLNLYQFSGSVYDKSVRLNWSTVSEINTAYFELEKSNNGSRFEKIGRVNASNNSVDKKEYFYVDINAMVGSGKIFYRLKMVDNDGKFTYSKVIAVNRSNNGGLVTYPNPVRTELILTVNSRQNKQFALNIFDAGGKQVYSRQLSAVPGNNNYKVNVAPLLKGSYYLNLVIDEGIETAKFIKE